MIMDGKQVAQRYKNALAEEVADSMLDGFKPCLAVVSVGADSASEVYVRSKQKACEVAGVLFTHKILESGCTQKELVDTIESLNQSQEVTGIILQLPIPKHLDAKYAIEHILPEKDVDGLTSVNAGRALNNIRPHYLPCTPMGIIKLMAAYKIRNLAGKHAVIVGRSQLVGKPLINLLLDMDATVTVCHSKTSDLAQYTRQADVLICAVGKPRLITADMVKPGAVVIDVGINRVNGKLCGDVDFENVQNIASLITPVPGGVGQMTVASLLDNVVISSIYSDKINKKKYYHPDKSLFELAGCSS